MSIQWNDAEKKTITSKIDSGNVFVRKLGSMFVLPKAFKNEKIEVKVNTELKVCKIFLSKTGWEYAVGIGYPRNFIASIPKQDMVVCKLVNDAIYITGYKEGSEHLNKIIKMDSEQ